MFNNLASKTTVAAHDDARAKAEAPFQALESNALFLLQQLIRPESFRRVRGIATDIEKLNVALDGRVRTDYHDRGSDVRGLTFSQFTRLYDLRHAYMLLQERQRDAARGGEREAKLQETIDHDFIPALHRFIKGSSAIQEIATLGLTMPEPLPRSERSRFLLEYLQTGNRLSGPATYAEVEAKPSTLRRLFGKPSAEIGDKTSIEWDLVFNQLPITVFHPHHDGENPEQVAAELIKSDKAVSWHLNAHIIFDFDGFLKATELPISYRSKDLDTTEARRKAAQAEGFWPLLVKI